MNRDRTGMRDMAANTAADIELISSGRNFDKLTLAVDGQMCYSGNRKGKPEKRPTLNSNASTFYKVSRHYCE